MTKAVCKVFLCGSLETNTISEITQDLITHSTIIYTYMNVPLICIKFQKISTRASFKDVNINKADDAVN